MLDGPNWQVLALKVGWNSFDWLLKGQNWKLWSNVMTPVRGLAVSSHQGAAQIPRLPFFGNLAIHSIPGDLEKLLHGITEDRDGAVVALLCCCVVVLLRSSSHSSLFNCCRFMSNVQVFVTHEPPASWPQISRKKFPKISRWTRQRGGNGTKEERSEGCLFRAGAPAGSNQINH